VLQLFGLSVQKLLQQLACVRSCGVNQCTRNHHRLLHQDTVQPQPQQQPLQQRTHNPETTLIHVDESAVRTKAVLLRIVPVVLKGPTGEFSTFALLDDASTVTMVDNSVAEKIGVQGPASTLCCVWTKKKVQVEENSKKVSIDIRTPNGENTFALRNVQTISDLALPELCLDADELHSAYPFVGEKTWRAIQRTKPTILIGQDHADLTVTRRVIQPDPEGVILSKCRLEWTAHGPIVTKSKLPSAETLRETFLL
jgi:hypothetical protein